MRIRLKQIAEPRLVFGGGVVHQDPRVGLQEGGLLTSAVGSDKPISLGLVCPEDEERAIRRWFQSLTKPKLDTVSNALRFPPFPGSNEALGCRFVIEERDVRVIRNAELNQALNGRKPDVFDRCLEIYSEKIATLFKDGGPRCIVVGIPEELAMLRIENPALGFKERSILRRLQDEVASEQMELFDTGSKEEEEAARQLLPQADDLLFRIWQRALKATCMKGEGAVPIQVIRRHTYTQDAAKQNDATKAWNIGVGMSYKSGEIPWKPEGLTPNTCYVGISFHHLKRRSGDVVYASLAQAYSTDTEPYAIRGICLPKNQTINRQPYLTDEQAASIISDVCKRFGTETGGPPQRVVVHKSSVFRDSEISGFRRCMKEGVAQVDMVSMRASGFRLINRGDTEVHRGSLVIVENERIFLFTSGFVENWHSYPGPHIPSPLELRFPGTEDVELCASELVALTKMNWNNAEGIGRVPITLAFSQQVGSILSETPEGDAIQPFYRFYM